MEEDGGGGRGKRGEEWGRGDAVVVKLPSPLPFVIPPKKSKTIPLSLVAAAAAAVSCLLLQLFGFFPRKGRGWREKGIRRCHEEEEEDKTGFRHPTKPKGMRNCGIVYMLARMHSVIRSVRVRMH